MNSPWPSLRKLRLVGGPNGDSVEAQLDGEKIQRCSRVVVDAGVGDAVRITTYQYAEVEVEVEGVVADGGTIFRAKVFVYPPRHLNESSSDFRATSHRIEVTADTPWDALRDVATQLELEGSQGIAPSGTVAGPSGRPPGH